MKPLSLLVAACFAAVAVGGCTGAVSQDDAPKTHEFTIVVHQGTSDRIALYEKNDGSQSQAVAITFQTPEQVDANAPQALPGPEIRVKEGDTVILHFQNPNALMHTIHLHGGLVPWEQDGVDYLTQDPTMPGGEYNYTYANLKAGTYWYHCHVDGAHHIDFGMYGALIVEERHPTVHFDREYVVFLDEYDNCHVHGNTDPVYAGNGTGNQEPTPDVQTQSQCYYRFLLDNLAQNQAVNQVGATTGGAVPQAVKDQFCPQFALLPESTPQEKAAKQNAQTAFGCTEAHAHGTPPPQQNARTWWPTTHPIYNPEYNTFLINGKAFPDSPAFPVKQGETVKFRLINAGNLLHTWHPHGHTMVVTHKDGYELPAAYKADTLAIAPGERYDFVIKMDNPGLWMIHDQMGQYAANDNQHPGGIMACMPYDGFHGIDAFAMKRALDCNTAGMAIYGGHHHPGA
jgi:FtsP/CotA-like multicopper oxidase with cupredoxin domain